MKRGGSLSFLVGTIRNVLVMEIGRCGERGVYLSEHSNTSFQMEMLVDFTILVKLIYET